MVDRWTGRETRLLRHALRLSVRAFAEDLGVSPRTVSKWESGGSDREPRPELQAALDTLLRRAPEEDHERLAQSLGIASAPGQVPMPGSWQDPPTSPPVRPSGDVRTALGDAAAQAAAFSIWWEQVSTGPVSVDLLFAELRRLAAAYLDGPPEPAVLAVLDLRDGIFELIRRHQPPDRARDLHLAAGYACVLLSWFSGDLGQSGPADTHARAGSVFAKTSGSFELQAWVQAARSKTALWVGEYRTAVNEATVGLSVAPATGVRVLLAAQVADAWATAGVQEQAQASLGDVAAARQAVAGSDQVGGLLSCNPAREANYVSGVHEVLGAFPEAIRTGDKALALSRGQAVRSYATEAQIRLNLVWVFLRLGDVEAATEVIRPVFALPVERRLHTLTARVGQLNGVLTAHRFAGSQAAEQLRHQALTFTGEPLGAAG